MQGTTQQDTGAASDRATVTAAWRKLQRAESAYSAVADEFGADSVAAVSVGHAAACAFADYRRMVDGS
jgi:hypothetical protein